jgi:D-inositol-3-phosphate glycosyltransferase
VYPSRFKLRKPHFRAGVDRKGGEEPMGWKSSTERGRLQTNCEVPAVKGRDEMQVSLLTGGSDRHYTFGLAMSLISKGVQLDIVGGDGLDSPEMHETPGLNFLNMREKPSRNAGLLKKAMLLLAFYAHLIAYAWNARPEIFHILWNNKILHFDRTILILYYKMLGKKIAITAHNVNRARRDGCDSKINRLSLKIQYRLADHIFVHTNKMKAELLQDFGVSEKAVTVIPFGINNAVPNSNLTFDEAKRRLGIAEGEKTILFFGNMRPSKGLEYLLDACEQLMNAGENIRLIVAGQPIKEFKSYWSRILPVLRRIEKRGNLILRSEFIPDGDIPLYFKAADVLVLPYTDIFQSGVLFLGYSFGLPVIAADVGSLGEDIIEGRTGFLCRPCDVDDLAGAIEKYYASDLFSGLKDRRQEIRDYANSRHSWSNVAAITHAVYQRLTEQTPLYSRLLHFVHSFSDSGHGS